METFILEFKYRVAGIPCLVGVTYWEPFIPATFHDPTEGGYVEWRILDRTGHTAPWLEGKLDDEMREQIGTKAIELLEKGEH